MSVIPASHRSVPALLVLLVAASASPAAVAGQTSADRPPGERLYSARACASCHGTDARGAVAPALAGTDLVFERFLSQLRSPRALMPAFSEGLVSDGQARAIWEYVRSLEAPTAGDDAVHGCRMRGHPHGRPHRGCGRRGPGHLRRHGPPFPGRGSG